MDIGIETYERPIVVYIKVEVKKTVIDIDIVKKVNDIRAIIII